VIERGGDPGYRLSIGPSGGQTSLVLEVRDGGSTYYLRGATTVPLFDGYWHHVAASYEEDPGDTTFYVDGQGTTGLFLLLPLTLGNADQLLIGRDQASTSFDGWIDELHLYDRALDEAEIQSIYDSGTSGVCPNGGGVVFGGIGIQAFGSFETTIGPSPSSAEGSVLVQVATSPGESPEDVAANVAAAINANSTLQAQGISAVASGSRVDIEGGVIHGASATDPDLSFVLVATEGQPAPVPLLTPGATAGLALLLGVVGLVLRRRRMRRSGTVR
jgi:hypothetical protein